MPSTTERRPARQQQQQRQGTGEGGREIPPERALVVIEATLDEHMDEVANLLPSTVNLDRFRELTLQEIARDPKLMRCSPMSLVRAVTSMAKVGLEPVLGEAYLVPFWNTKESAYNATLIIGYPGLQTLAYRSGLVTLIEGDVVYESDEWDYVRGFPDGHLRHVPVYAEDRGKALGAWSMIWLRDAPRPLMDFLPEARIEQARKVSRSGTGDGGQAIGIWHTWRDEMRAKTALRHGLKLAPKSVVEVVRTALDVEDAVDSILRAEAADVAAIPATAGGRERSTQRRRRLLGRVAGRKGAEEEPAEGDEPVGSTETGGEGEPAPASSDAGAAVGQAGEPPEGPGNAEPADPEPASSETKVCGDPSPYPDTAACGINDRGQHKVHKALGPKGEVLATWPRK